MSLQAQLRESILEILADYQNHSKKEIEKRMMEKGLIIEGNAGALRNALHHLKVKSKEIESVEKGYYRLKKRENNIQGEKEHRVMTATLNVDELQVIIGKINKELEYLNNLNYKRCSDEENISARQKIKMLDALKNEMKNF